MLKAAWKSLLARKVRLLMSTFAIVLGVAFVVGSLIFSDTLGGSFTRLFSASAGDVVVRPHGSTTLAGDPSTRTVPASLVGRLQGTPGAARVDGTVRAVGVFVIGKDDKVVGGFGAPGIGANWTDAPAGHGSPALTLVRGHAPRGPDEVVLDSQTAILGGYLLGEKVRVVTAGRKAVLHPTLVGTVDYGTGGSLNGATLTVFDTRTAQRLFLQGKDRFTTLWVTAADGVSQKDLASAVRQELPRGYDAVTGDKASDESASQVLKGVSFLRTFLLIFAGIALVVGGYLIVNTFTILVAQRSRELALLRALGASARQVSRTVLFEALVLGLAGSTLGAVLGLALAAGIRALVGSFGLDLASQPLVVAPRSILVGYAVGVAVTMVAAWLPARRTTRIAPVQALGDVVALPESSIRRRLVAGIVAVVAGVVALGEGLFGSVPHTGWWVGGGIFAILLGVSAAAPVICRPFLVVARALFAVTFRSVGALAGHNSLRNPRRTTATASALMIGLTLACTMAIVGASAKASVDDVIAENFVGDYVVGSTFGQPFSPTVADKMARVDGVTKVLRERFQYVEVDGDQRGLTAIDPRDAGALALHFTDGTPADLTGRTVAISDKLASKRHLEVGDTVTLGKLPVGSRKFRVVGVFADTPLVFPLVTSLATYDTLGFSRSDNALIVFARAGADVLPALQQVVKDLPVVSVSDEAGFAEQQRKPIDQLVLMVYALLGLALVIAILGIVNTLALSVIERTREIGLLRAIGLGRGQLRVMITLESVAIALLGTLLGVGLGIGFGIALMRAVRDQGLTVIAVPWSQVGLFLVLSVVVGVLAAVIPARRAARLDVLRAISTD